MEQREKIKVVILGGGVAGLSAAHHLLTKGQGKFEVVIIERRDPGGKARSQTEETLPTEHGFRFFPGFYKHVTETMKEIPLENGGNVYDNNLVNTEYYTFLFTGKRGRLDVPIHIGGSIRKLRLLKLVKQLRKLKDQIKYSNIDISQKGQEYFGERMLEVYTSCNERIESVYDNISWTDFIDAKDLNKIYGNDYENLLATGISKNLVAVRADVANSRTGAKLVGHMIWHIINPSAPPADKLLNAPTQVAWLDPWMKFLKGLGLKIYSNQRVITLEFDHLQKKITGVKYDKVDQLKELPWNWYDKPENPMNYPIESGDYFICAMPIEKTDLILNRSRSIDPASGKKIMIKEVDSSLNNFSKLWRYTEWMNGVIFYFDTNIDITNGHITVADEEAAVTLISQLQYWEKYLENNTIKYNGIEIKAVLSVIVSNWDAPSKYIARKGVALKKLKREEVIEEVKEIIFRCEDEAGQHLERYRAHLIHTILDNSIIPYDQTKANPNYLPKDRDISGLYNKEPLFINKVFTYHLRPEASTRFSNLCMASDYLKTNADLGCMDSADEAARRAVNNIFETAGMKPVCRVNSYSMPRFFGLFSTARMIDYRRFRKGLPYSDKTIIHRIIKFFAITGKSLLRAKFPTWLKIPMFLIMGLIFFVVVLINYLFKPYFIFRYARSV